MSRMTIALSCFAFLLTLVSSFPCWADVDSGPASGEKVSELKVYAVIGEVTDEELDYAKQRGEKPTVYLFVKAEQFSRPIARFMRALDSQLTEISPEAYIVAVWLTDDKEKTKEYLPRLQGSVNFDNTALTYFPGDAAAGPNNWGVNDLADFTAVVVHQSKSVASFGFISVNETDVPKIADALKEAVKE